MSEKIRQGNDIRISWSLIDEDEHPYNLEGRNIAIELHTGKKKVRIKEHSISGNTVYFTYYGKDQKYIGSYNLVFIENDGQVDMVTFDTKDAFTLVEHSWLAIDEGETPETIQLEFVTITSELTERIGPPGAAAGFGTVDAEVDDTLGPPSVDVETSGPNTAKNIHFSFHGLTPEMKKLAGQPLTGSGDIVKSLTLGGSSNYILFNVQGVHASILISAGNVFYLLHTNSADRGVTTYAFGTNADIIATGAKVYQRYGVGLVFYIPTVYPTEIKFITLISDGSISEREITATAISSLPSGYMECAINTAASKDYVDNAVATSSATFLGTSATGLSKAQFLAWTDTLNADLNDYCYWDTVDSVGNQIYKRYKYDGSQWLFEYSVSVNEFSVEQMAAINSGIDAEKVAQISKKVSVAVTSNSPVLQFYPNAPFVAIISSNTSALALVEFDGTNPHIYDFRGNVIKAGKRAPTFGIELPNGNYYVAFLTGGNASNVYTDNNRYSGSELFDVVTMYVKPLTGIPASDIANDAIKSFAGVPIKGSGDVMVRVERALQHNGFIIKNALNTTCKLLLIPESYGGFAYFNGGANLSLIVVENGANNYYICANSNDVFVEIDNYGLNILLLEGTMPQIEVPAERPTVGHALTAQVIRDTSNFITKSVNNLTNYYLKSETCTKTEVTTQIANALDGVVKFDESQSLTDAQKTQARTNIGAGTYSKPSNGIPASDLAEGVIPETIESAEVSVDANTGTPSASASVSGGVLSLEFHNLKGNTGATGATGPQGPQGPQGPIGPQGNTGASVDYPYELVDNLTTDDPTKGLSAAQGVVLDGKISRLGQEVNGVQSQNYEEGKYINKLGNLIQNDDWGVSDFIPYSQGDSVVWKYGGGIYSNACICFFNSQKQFITYWEASSGTGTKTISPSEIAQWAANGAFIRASFRLANMETAGVVTGNTTWNPENTETSGLVGEVQRLEAEKQDILTFDTTPIPGSSNPVTSDGVFSAIKNIDFTRNFTKDKYINYNGVEVNSTKWSVSEPIQYSSGSSVVWKYGTPEQDAPCLVFLDSNKQLISGAYWTANNSSGQRTINASDIVQYAPNAAYLRASFHTEYADAMVMVSDSVWTPNPGVEFDPTSVIDGIAKNSFHSVYCTESVTAKQKEFCALFKSAGIADAFVFMTDPHLMGSENTFNEETAFRPYLSVLQRYKNSIPASFLLSGGDWLNNKDYQDFACWKLGIVDSTMRKLFPGEYRPVLGNHDTNYQGYVSADDLSRGDLSHEALRGLMFNKESNTYYDFFGTNGHYFVLDTGDDFSLAMNTFRWEQIAWLAQKLQANEDANVVVVMHIYSNAGDASTWSNQKSQMANNVQTLLGAYNNKTSVSLNGASYNFANSTGKCRCIICGHSHFDHIDASGNVPVICTTNFTSGNTPTFDMMLIDFTAGVLTAIRVGTGNNRTMNLA